MSTITDQFQHAQLAAAAYTDFVSDSGSLLIANVDIIAALQNTTLGGKFREVGVGPSQVVNR